MANCLKNLASCNGDFQTDLPSEIETTFEMINHKIKYNRTPTRKKLIAMRLKLMNLEYDS